MNTVVDLFGLSVDIAEVKRVAGVSKRDATNANPIGGYSVTYYTNIKPGAMNNAVNLNYVSVDTAMRAAKLLNSYRMAFISLFTKTITYRSGDISFGPIATKDILDVTEIFGDGYVIKTPEGDASILSKDTEGLDDSHRIFTFIKMNADIKSDMVERPTPDYLSLSQNKTQLKTIKADGIRAANKISTDEIPYGIEITYDEGNHVIIGFPSLPELQYAVATIREHLNIEV